MIRTTSTPSKLEQRKALLGRAAPVKALAAKPKSKPSKAENSVTTFAVAQDITDVATIEQQIEQHAQNIERIQGNAILEIGRELKLAQELFRFKRDEGGFTGWLAARLPHINQRAAYRAIQRYEGVEEFDEFVKLSGAAQDEVVSAGPDVKAIIAGRVEAGEVFTAAQVKAIKDAAAKEADEFKAKLEAAEKEKLEAAEKAKAEAEKRIKELEALAAEPKPEPEQPALDLEAEIAAATRSKQEEIDALKKQIDAIQNDPAMKAMREAVESAARNGGKKADNKNPHYQKPTAEYDEMMKVVGTCRILLDRTKKTKPAVILAGFHDDEHRAEGLKAIAGCRDFLTSILEAANAA